MKKYTSFILAATVLCFLLGYLSVLAGGFQHGFPKSVLLKFSDKNDLKSVELHKTFAAKKRVSVLGISDNITIKEANSEQIEIHYRGIGSNDPEKNPLNITETAEEIRIQPSNKFTDNRKNIVYFSWNSNSPEENITINLPAGVAALNIENTSGDIDIKTHELQNLAITTVSGDCKIIADNIGEFIFSTTSGELKMESRLQKMRGKSISGDLALQIRNPDPEIDLQTTSGDSAINIKSAPNAYLIFQSISGDLLLKNLEGKTTRADHYFEQKLDEGKGKIQVNSISGDLDFRSSIFPD